MTMDIPTTVIEFKDAFRTEKDCVKAIRQVPLTQWFHMSELRA